MRIVRCPMLDVPPAAWDALDAAWTYYRHRLLPAAGGTWDQAEWFLRAAAFLAAEWDRQRAEDHERLRRP